MDRDSAKTHFNEGQFHSTLGDSDDTLFAIDYGHSELVLIPFRECSIHEILRIRHDPIKIADR